MENSCIACPNIIENQESDIGQRQIEQEATVYSNSQGDSILQNSNEVNCVSEANVAKSIGNFNGHIEAKQGNPDDMQTKSTFTCHICRRTFKLKPNLRKHIVTLHTNKRQHECKICHKTFHEAYVLRNHVISHVHDRNFSCHICFKSLKSNKSVRKHMLAVHTDKRHECNTCYKKFKSAYVLKMHQISHTTDKNFSCSLCTRKFKFNHTLKRHFKSKHLNEIDARET